MAARIQANLANYRPVTPGGFFFWKSAWGPISRAQPSSIDVNAPPTTASVDAIPVEITMTVTVVVHGQKSEDIDDVEVTKTEPEHPTAAPT